jgi:hypothetical protein
VGKATIDGDDPSSGSVELPDGQALRIKAIGSANKARLIIADDGSIGVASDDAGDNGLISGGKSIEFRFPFGQRTVVTRVVLSSFTPNDDVGLLEWGQRIDELSNDTAAAAAAAAFDGSLELLSADTTTDEFTDAGYTLYRLSAQADSSFGVRSLSVRTASATQIVGGPPAEPSGLSTLYLALIVGGGVCCCLVLALIIVLVVRSRNGGGGGGGGDLSDGTQMQAYPNEHQGYGSLQVSANEPAYASARDTGGQGFAYQSSEGSNYQAVPGVGAYQSSGDGGGTYQAPVSGRYNDLALRDDEYLPLALNDGYQALDGNSTQEGLYQPLGT